MSGPTGLEGVQFTPPGSPSSIQLGSGPAARFYLIVSDIETTRAEPVARGVGASEVFHRGTAKDSRLSGPDPERRSYASFVTATIAWSRRSPNDCRDE
jgi:hypothetical protein